MSEDQSTEDQREREVVAQDTDDSPEVCDHCRSNTDHCVEGMRGHYCSNECYYAEEIDGPKAHDSAIDSRECPGCYGDYLTDDIMVVVDECDMATVRMADWTPSGMYEDLTDATERAVYAKYDGDRTLEEMGADAAGTGRKIGWAAIDEERNEVVHVEVGA